VTFAEGYPETIYRLMELADDAPPVVLRRDPDNPHDPNAIQVVCVGAGGHIGHVPAAVAARLAPELDDGVAWDVEFDSINVHSAHIDRPGIVLRLRRA
jgi:hypothetical protein